MDDAFGEAADRMADEFDLSRSRPLTEGWLRLNPQVLEFRLNGPDGTPVVPSGETTTLRLLITNKRGVPVTFTPATTHPPNGSVFYVHFGTLVDRARVGAIRPDAPGWRFDLVTDPQLGPYWAAIPESAVTLAPNEQLTMSLADVAVAATARAQARVYFDYHDITGVDDGVDVAVLTIAQSTAVRR